MRSFASIMAGLFVLLGGCATAPVTPDGVLSGGAPVEQVIRQGDAAAVAGDFEAAALMYTQALAQQPDADTWYRLGMAHTYRAQPRQALWAFEKALELDAAHRDALERLALYYTANNVNEQAGVYLARLLAVDEQNWRAHNALGVLADLEQRFEDAAGHYRRAVELNLGSAILWNNLGYSRYLAEDFALAQTYFEHALTLDARYEVARHNLALVHARQRRFDEAVAIMSGNGDVAAAYCDVGYLAFRMGDYARAEALLVEGIRRSPTYNGKAQQNLRAVRQAIWMESSG